MANSTIDELKSAWNAQADRANQWDELGLDEIVDFAQQQMQKRIDELESLRASPVYGRVLKADAERIVAYVLDVCAEVAERWGNEDVVDGIREITPEQIMSSLAASQQPADRIADSGITIDAQSGEKQ